MPTRQSVRTVDSVSLASTSSRISRSNNVLEHLLGLCSGNTTCASSRVLRSLDLIRTWNTVRLVGNPATNRRNLRNLMASERSLGRFLLHFLWGRNSRARWKHSQTAKDMFYRWEKTDALLRECAVTGEPPQLFNDIFCGYDYLNLVCNGQINKYDSVLMLSIDGAQLYESKQSDVWIYI